MILSDEDIDTLERMLFNTDKLLGLLEQPHSHCLELEHDDYAEMVNGLNALKKGCEITLQIQKERKNAQS